MSDSAIKSYLNASGSAAPCEELKQMPSADDEEAKGALRKKEKVSLAKMFEQ